MVKVTDLILTHKFLETWCTLSLEYLKVNVPLKKFNIRLAEIHCTLSLRSVLCYVSNYREQIVVVTAGQVTLLVVGYLLFSCS